MSGWMIRVMVTHSEEEGWVKVTLPGRSPVTEIFRAPFRAVALFAGGAVPGKCREMYVSGSVAKPGAETPRQEKEAP